MDTIHNREVQTSDMWDGGHSAGASFGKWVALRRKSVRLQQAELATLAHCAPITLRKIESDERRPSAELARSLAVQLDLPTDLDDTFLRVARGELSASRLPAPDSRMTRQVPIPATSTEIQSNLPAHLIAFIGRAHELDAVRQRIQTNRLVTLIGTGGVGKTRLALESAADVMDRFPDGVFVAELASLTDPQRVGAALAAALDLPDSGQSWVSQLKLHLRRKQFLLVLDNCEHLIGSCAELAGELLQACPHLHILATSREPLRITGEVIWRVPSMSVSEATALFEARAQEVAPGLVFSAEDEKIAAHICERLDGIPLAIELAASRLRTYSISMIAERLDDRFALLTGGSRAALQRHQTLRTLIDWSYNLLSGDAQRLLRYLSVFAGGWRVDAAEAIGQGEHAVATLAELVDKSLVHTFESGSRHRYAMLETIREYAGEKLKEAGENDDAHERMASYLRTLAASQGTNKAAMHAEFAGELDNVRTCMSWARAHADPEHHLRMVLSLGMSVTNSCRLAEPLAWLSEALDRAAEAPMSLRLNGMISELGLMTFSGYHLTRWKPRVHDPIEAARILGDTALIFEVLFWMGAVVWQQGDYARVIALYEQGLARATSLKTNSDTYPTLGIVQPLDQVIANFTWGIGLVKMQLGDIDSAQNCFWQCVQVGIESDAGNGNPLFLGLSGCTWLNPNVASTWSEQALPCLRRRASKVPLAYALQAYAQALIIKGDTDQALATLQESLGIWRDLKLTWESSNGSAQTLLDLGQAEWLRGDMHAARAWYELSLAEYAQVGDRERLARLQIYIGLTHLAQGRQELAAQHFAVGLNVYRELGQPAGLALSLAAYARLAESLNQLDRSALLYRAASTCTQLELMSASVLWPASAVVFQREIANAHARHSHLPSTHAWHDGKRQTLMQAIKNIHDLTEI